MLVKRGDIQSHRRNRLPCIPDASRASLGNQRRALSVLAGARTGPARACNPCQGHGVVAAGAPRPTARVDPESAFFAA